VLRGHRDAVELLLRRRCPVLLPRTPFPAAARGPARTLRRLGDWAVIPPVPATLGLHMLFRNASLDELRRDANQSNIYGASVAADAFITDTPR
jgi:hypothetical protein